LIGKLFQSFNKDSFLEAGAFGRRKGRDLLTKLGIDLYFIKE
jgi:hypothetical protein